MLLAGITLFSLASCKDDGAGTSDASSVEESSTQEEVKEKNPNHDFSYTETNDWLVKGGVSDYAIVMPAENTTTLLSYAKTELVTIFKEATGVELPVVTDDQVATHTASGKYISLGDTKLYESANLGIDKRPLIEDGVRIVTKDKTIYLVGGKDEGVLYAVYDFLNLNFGFETYYKDCYDLQTGVKDLKLMKYDVTDIPDIPFRKQGTGATTAISNDYDDMMYTYRIRSYDAYWKRILLIHERWDDNKSKCGAEHNSFMFLPPDEYGESDPEFYSTQGNQLCFTARGDKAKYNKMMDLCFKKVVQSLKWYTPETNPDMNFVQIGMEDNLDWCTCDACNAAIAKYGAKSSTVLMFCNDLSDKIQEWMAQEENKAYARENFKVMFFAYQATLEPPYKWNEERQEYYTPYEELIPRNVTVFLAVSGFDHSRSIYNDRNAAMYENVRGWGAYMDDIFFWTYGGFISDYFSFADVYNFYQDIYGFFHEVGGSFCLTQQHSSQKGADSGFFILAGYVCSKMMWDSSLDVNDLIDNYMNAMYKEAAPAMKQLFDHERTRFNIQYTQFSWSWTAWWNKPSFSSQYWTVGYVNEAFRLLDEAYSAIEKYKNDETLYNAMKGRIDMEWLSPAKVAIDNYEENFTVDEYKQMKAKFKKVVADLGISNIGELDKIDSYLAGL